MAPVRTLERTEHAGSSRLAPSPAPVGRRPVEWALFLAASAAIVLHVLVDELVTAESGATRADHLLAALVPIALVGAAVVAYPRLPAGARASIALALGALALVGGGLAVEAARVGVFGAATWTGLLLLPAGAALLVAACLLLWRSRKPGRYRYLRRALLAAVALAVAYWIVAPVGMALVATHIPRVAVADADLGRPHQTVTLRTSDGLDLAGWYVPSGNGAAVVVYPNRTDTVPIARMLAGAGYGVLVLDMRGRGESEGDANLFGWDASPDLDAAVAFLQKRPDVVGGRIGGLGLSVGGEALLDAAAANPDLRAVVSEGAGMRSVRESFAREGVSALQVWLQLPFDAVVTAATAVFSGDSPPPSLEGLVPRAAPRPLLFVYGAEGQAAETALTPAYYAAAGEPKLLWEVPGAAHTGGLEAAPAAYERRVVGFFDRALLGR